MLSGIGFSKILEKQEDISKSQKEILFDYKSIKI